MIQKALQLDSFCYLFHSLCFNKTESCFGVTFIDYFQFIIIIRNGPLPLVKACYNNRILHSSSKGVDLTFEKVSYSVELEQPSCFSKRITKTILENMSGLCRAGEMTAIMGSSGSGKTTLLSVLSKRINVEGASIKANGNSYDFE